jgi:hypothetical protein
MVRYGRQITRLLWSEQLGGEDPPQQRIPRAIDAWFAYMAWEIMRAALRGLALWWYEHQHVPREQVVATAMNAVWIGFERMLAGEIWQP